MPTGAITNYIDVAQLVLYAFWIFFAGLIFYLRSEDKREGYPLESDRSGHIKVQGFPPIPTPKTFILPHGAPQVPVRRERTDIAAVPVGPWPGAPLDPVGDPMRAGVGPGSYVERSEEPDRMFEGGLPKIVPLRVATGYRLESRDPDPRGMTVVGADHRVAGTVRDVWVDRSETLVRFLEVETTAEAGGRTVLLPMTLVRIDAGRRRVRVRSILAAQFAHVPGLANPEQVTLREEDLITAYYAGGQLYATPDRLGPLV
jgi:photosynthetic reaction center H subunit